MHCVDPYKARPAFRRWLAPFSDGDRRRACGGVVDALPPIAHTVAQIVQVPDRDCRQPFALLIPEHLVFSFQDRAGRRPIHPPVSLIDFDQRRHIRRRVASPKPTPPIHRRFDHLRLDKLADQPRHLRSAQSRHFGHVAPHQPLGVTAQLGVPLLPQRPVHPSVDISPALGVEMHLRAACQKSLHLLQARILDLLHSNEQSPAWSIRLPSGSSCIEIDLFSRLILYWTRLRCTPPAGCDTMLARTTAAAQQFVVKRPAMECAN